MDMEDRMQHEIELIEQDDSLTSDEKRREIREIQREYRDAAKESAQQAYDEEFDRW